VGGRQSSCRHKRGRGNGAGDGIRTRDIQLGRPRPCSAVAPCSRRERILSSYRLPIRGRLGAARLVDRAHRPCWRTRNAHLSASQAEVLPPGADGLHPSRRGWRRGGRPCTIPVYGAVRVASSEGAYGCSGLRTESGCHGGGAVWALLSLIESAERIRRLHGPIAGHARVRGGGFATAPTSSLAALGRRQVPPCGNGGRGVPWVSRGSCRDAPCGRSLSL
jgi:hypothetical protein